MPAPDDLAARVDAIERTLTDGHVLADLPDGAALAARVDDLEERADRIERRLDELDAATQALRGYVGNVRSVNRDVERRADAALAAVEELADDGPLHAPNGERVNAVSSGDDATSTDGSPDDSLTREHSPNRDADPTDRDGDAPDAIAETVLARVRESL